MGRLAKSIWLVVACWSVAVLTADAQAPDGIERAIAQAESLYAAGAFDDPGPLLAYSTEDATVSQAAAVYRLLTLLYLENEAMPEAKVTVIRLLHRMPAYQPDPVADPPAYVALINEVQAQLLSPAPAPGSCQEAMAIADAQYVEGAFDEAAGVLAECLNQRLMHLSRGEQTATLRLLTLLYLKMSDLPEARSVVALLLELVPTYEPDPVRDPPGYVALVGLLNAVHSQQAGR